MKILSQKTAFIGVIVLVIIVVVLFSARNQRAANVDFLTAAVERGPLRNAVNATGVVQTVVTVQVGSQVSGQIEELYADYNSIVKHGQLLAKIDPRNFQAQLENAEASVAGGPPPPPSSEARPKTHARH